MKKLATFTLGILLLGTTLANAAGFISKATADQDALAATHGGRVVQTVLETTDNPVHYSVDIVKKNGAQYEVWVDAKTGRILSVIVGG